MANLVELFDNIVQMQNLNGVPLAAGKLYVYALGRTRLMDTWSDVDGESLNPNPIILDDAGQAHVYVSDDFDYTLVVCDQYNNEIFSLDKYLFSEGSHSHADVAVAPSEHIGVSSYHVGEVTVYVPYLTGEVGKVYEGIDPIVVNNDVNRISANHIPLGVQDPLYFVEDSETACIIGCSAQTEIPSELSGKWDEASDAVIANSAQWSEGTTYEAGSYVSIDDNTISVTGLQPEGDYAYNSALSSKLDVTALPQDLVHSGELTAYYPSDNPSGFLTAHQSLQGYATEQWVEDKGYLTSVDIPESAVWNATTQTVSANSAQWAGGTANPQIPVTGINGIKISESGDKVVFEVSGDYYPGNNPSGFITGVDLSDYATTAQVAEKQDSLIFGYKDTVISSIDNSALYDNSAHARINTLAGRISDLSSNKLDTTAFSDVSGTFLTAHQDLSDYQTTAGMTAYQEAGDYYSASNPSGFITDVDLTPYQLTADMTAYQPVGNYQTAGDYLTTADSANFYTTANESGFISEVPAGTMNESAFGYDANDKISGYNGSAFAGGSDVPEGVMVESGLEYDASGNISAYSGSAFATQLPEEEEVEFEEINISGISAATDYVTATSANIDSTIDNVSSNSGAWGGSALPISAGPGIKFEMVNDTLVASTDETLLWSGNGTSITAFTVSEPLTNFKEVVFNVAAGIGDGVGVQKVIIPMVGNNTSALYLVFDSTWNGFTGINFTFKFNNTGMSAFSLSTGAWFGFNNNGTTTGNFTTLYGYEIYGVKRIAGGN